MRSFFEDAERRASLAWVANSWVGTPFRKNARLKGVGVDCVNLAGAIYIETGFMNEFRPPEYNLDHGTHHDHSLVMEWIEKSGLFAPATGPSIGDLICFKNGRCSHHVGVVINARQFIHAMYDHMAAVSELEDTTFKKRLEAVWRPIQKG